VRAVASTSEGVPGQPRRDNISIYTDLAKAVRERGLLRRRYAYYWTKIAGTTLAFTLVWLAVVLIGDSWLQIVPAALVGILLAQFGFLGHDAAHQQMFASARWNEWASRLIAGAFVGMSYGWWRTRHNRHHSAPNQAGSDPDISPGPIAFTREIVASRSGFAGWFAHRQGWFFFPLLTLEGFNLQISSVRTLMGAGSVPHRRTEATLVLIRLLAYFPLLFVLMPAEKAVAFYVVQMAVFGFCLGASFAPSHKGMPIVPPAMKIDFLRRQVMMSRNVRGGLLVDFFMGGLNYQIEHHLFPSMPRANLRLAQPLVRAYCAEHEVPYTEKGLFESYGIVVGYLNNVGLRASEPFACPLVTQYRTEPAG
jgi:fatty acid desaturase